MGTKPKFLIVATHPIQYQVPWYRYLQEHVNEYEFTVLYLTLPNAVQQGAGFGQSFEWDIPLLEGYQWCQAGPEHLRGNGALDDFKAIRLSGTNRLIKKLNPDAVLLTGWQCLGLLQIMLTCKLLNIPAMIRAESNGLKPVSKIKSAAHRLLVKQYSSCLAIGKANSRFYQRHGVKPAILHDCPYFVDNSYFSEQASALENIRMQARRNWCIPDGACCFCYVGKLTPKKRILDVLSSMEELAGQPVHLLVVGTGELLQQAQSYVTRHSLNVTFTGFLNQSEICAAYVASDCLVLASDYDETWGLVVNEAMACGKPAIVSDRCGCHPDLVDDGQTGYLFRYSDTDDLANKMTAFTNLSYNDRTVMGKKALQNVTVNYSITKATQGMTLALKQLLHQ